MQEQSNFLPGEVFWRDRFEWLQQSGYELRPRYKPDWVPSWLNYTDKLKKYDAEDFWWTDHRSTVDATRLSDGKPVVLKKLKQSVHPQEVEIGLFLSSPELASDPRNHCVPIYEVLSGVQDDSDLRILVMPMLRDLGSPKFDTCGEIVECFRQLIEGLQFMHSLNVAHGDCNDLNIMMDATPMYPRGYHPANTGRERDGKKAARPYTRTQKPTKYFFVDFGISYKFDSLEAREKVVPIRGGDKSVPEFQNGGVRMPQDPFPTDVYYLGNVMKQILQGDGYYPGYRGLEVLNELVADMRNDDPLKRPTIDEVALRYDKILQSLSSWKLRRRAQRLDETFLLTPFKATPYWFRRIKFVLTRTPALPRCPA